MYEDLADLKAGKVDSVRGQHYDLVLDGQEIGGGSVRIHDARLQEWVMKEVLQLDEQEIGRFDHLLRALKCGAPPHGGLALGKSFQSASSSLFTYTDWALKQVLTDWWLFCAEPNLSVT